MTGLIQGTVSKNSDVFRSWIWYEATENAGQNSFTLDIKVLVDHYVDGSDKKYTWNADVISPFIKVDSTKYTFTGVHSNNNNPGDPADTSRWTYTAAQSPTGYRAQLIMQKTLTVQLDQNGTKQLALSAGFSIAGTYAPGTVSINPVDAVNVTLSGTVTPQTPEEPGNITGINYTMARAGVVSLSWSASAGTVTGYQVQRKIRTRAGVEGEWTHITTTTERSFTEDATDPRNGGLTAGQSIQYRVRAMNGQTGGAFTQTYYLFLHGGLYAPGKQYKALLTGNTGGQIVRVTGFLAGPDKKESKTIFEKGV